MFWATADISTPIRNVVKVDTSHANVQRGDTVFDHPKYHHREMEDCGLNVTDKKELYSFKLSPFFVNAGSSLGLF